MTNHHILTAAQYNELQDNFYNMYLLTIEKGVQPLKQSVVAARLNKNYGFILLTATGFKWTQYKKELIRFVPKQRNPS